jgi:hypothetical protein
MGQFWLKFLKTGALVLALVMFCPPYLSDPGERYDWYPGILIMVFLMVAHKAAKYAMMRKLNLFDLIEVVAFCAAYYGQRLVLNDLWLASLKP